MQAANQRPTLFLTEAALVSSRRFARLSNGFSKRLENRCAAVSLYVAHYKTLPRA